MGVLKFNQAQAEAIINRYNKNLDDNIAIAESQVSNNLGDSGYADQLKQIPEEFISIVDSSGYTGTRVVAQALETVENQYGSALNDLMLFIIEYFETVDRPSAINATNEKEAEREKNITDITVALDNEINDIMLALDQEREEEERERREQEEKRREQEEREERKRKREERRRKQEELEKKYYRTRDNLRKQISRRRKAGITDISLPAIPQKITQGSINRLEDLMNNLQDEYRYLQGRGYRGANR